MSRRRLAALASVLVLGACGGADRAPVSTPVRPAELVGLWRVEGSAVPASTYLRVQADNRIFLFRDCGSAFGEWRGVAGGALALMLISGAADCPRNPGDDEWEYLTPTWLRAAAGFGTRGPDRVLRDATGSDIAALVPVNAAPGRDYLGERLPPDPPTAKERAALDRVLPPDPGLRRAMAVDLIGRWVPAGVPAPSEAPTRTLAADSAGFTLVDGRVPSDRRVFVEFDNRGGVVSRDGCNSGRGRWTIGPGGALAVVLSLSYVVACENAAVADWLQDAAWAVFDGSSLALVDADGHVVGTLLKS